MDAVRSVGGRLAAVCVMINRNPDEVTEAYFGAAFFPLDTLKIEAYDPPDCPLCRARIPVDTAVGHGQQFMASLAGGAR